MKLHEILSQQAERQQAALEEAMRIWKELFGHPSKPHSHCG